AFIFMANDTDDEDQYDDAARELAASEAAGQGGRSLATGKTPDIALLKDQVEILVTQRLPHLDQGPVQAYAARAAGSPGNAPYFALICEPSLAPRGHKAGAFIALSNPGLVKLVSSGVLYWP